MKAAVVDQQLPDIMAQKLAFSVNSPKLPARYLVQG
jgi:hypothetical protein